MGTKIIAIANVVSSGVKIKMVRKIKIKPVLFLDLEIEGKEREENEKDKDKRASDNKRDKELISANDPEYNKRQIIKLFMTNIKGKEIVIKNSKKHCGSEGHWLETQMGITSNSKNESDIFGYEMKKDSSKITFGDFSASEYLFSKNRETIEKLNGWDKNECKITRNNFLTYFGTPNPLKENRYSWSGSCVPKYGVWNSCGQSMYFDENLDLLISYSFEKDTREEKHSFPKYLQNCGSVIIIAIWKKGKLEGHINKKFNVNGFFICKKINNTYENICFGKPFDFNYFVDNVKNKNIIFDSGMYEGNSRNYSQFRSSAKNFWNMLITEEY